MSGSMLISCSDQVADVLNRRTARDDDVDSMDVRNIGVSEDEEHQRDACPQYQSKLSQPRAGSRIERSHDDSLVARFTDAVFRPRTRRARTRRLSRSAKEGLQVRLRRRRATANAASIRTERKPVEPPPPPDDGGGAVVGKAVTVMLKS